VRRLPSSKEEEEEEDKSGTSRRTDVLRGTIMPELSGYDDWLDNHGNPGINPVCLRCGMPCPRNEDFCSDECMFTEPCVHEFISWHGMRGECQECGEIVATGLPVQYLSPALVRDAFTFGISDE
jgi:hypothetical protein